MVNIRFITTDFASHRSWATGYQRATWKDKNQLHEVRLEFIPGDRWKYRMMSGCLGLVDKIALDDDIVVVDAMLDVSMLVALIGKNRPIHQSPKILIYFHENQLTTPFTSQDRDQKRQTHWHYGLAHWRSLLVADGCIFNSAYHLEAFKCALPKLINEQSPRDTVYTEIKTCKQLLARNCTVLHYGLELDELTGGRSFDDDTNGFIEGESGTNTWVPVILWNARLEEDKDPAKFVDLLHRVRKTLRFKLIILGIDPSKGQQWFEKLKSEFGEAILHVGWCGDRSEYSSWLRRASIVVSTARHETFGISVVESASCGVLPLLPRQLAYPEIFSALPDAYFYASQEDAVEKLKNLIEIVGEPLTHRRQMAVVRHAVAHFDWKHMLMRYDTFFDRIAKGDSITRAGKVAADLYTAALEKGNYIISNDGSCPNKQMRMGRWIEILDSKDARVQLYRPKSLRNYDEFNRQVSALRSRGLEPALHGGRRAVCRMLEAASRNAKFTPISFLTTRELADSVFSDLPVSGAKSDFPPIYIAHASLLNEIRGQKLNVGDAVLAMIHFPQMLCLDTILAKPPILILEEVRNAENVGTMLRTAFCLGITSIIATTTSWSALQDSRAARCSMGTQYYHNYFKAKNSAALVDAIKAMQLKGITVYGIEIDERSQPISAHENNRFALVMGNEDIGLSTHVALACDNLAEIPQASGDSLNVAVAASIAMHVLGSQSLLTHDGLASCR